MNKTEDMRFLIRGAYDLHVHSAPDLLPRKLDDIQMAHRLSACGMGGYALKNHYFCTAQRAEILSAYEPSCHFVGAVVLNSSVGGLNPAAVELSLRAGARIVWMPTCDSEHERAEVFNGNAKKQPFWAGIILELQKEGIENPTITLLKDGRLKPAVYDILSIARQYDAVLATGHISHEETFALARAAKACGFKKLLITHVDFPNTFYTIEEQRELLSLGAWLEHCYTTYATGKVDFEQTIHQIRATGTEKVILSSDLGQRSNVYPDEGMLDFAVRLYEKGFSQEEIERMNRLNPMALIAGGRRKGDGAGEG